MSRMFDARIGHRQALLARLHCQPWTRRINRDLRVVFKTRGATQPSYLIHPQPPMLAVLARKGNVEPETLVAKIAETIAILKDECSSGGNLEVLVQFLFNPYSLILTDDQAVTIPYFMSRRGPTVPAFIFENAGTGSHYEALRLDVESLRMDCERLLINEKPIQTVSYLNRTPG